MEYKFKEGDRVRLVKPFRCDGDDEETDEDIQRRLASAFGDEPITGTFNNYKTEWTCVHFDKLDTRPDGYDYYVNEDCLDFEIPPATDQEVEEAIRSIIGR